MRASLLVLAALSACGPVLLGHERDHDSSSSGARSLDGALARTDARASETGTASDGSVPQDAALPQLLCVRNASFEGTAAFNTGAADSFDLEPWSGCGSALGGANTPDVVNDTIPQMVASVPKPVDGQTYLGMAEQEQTSQQLCEDVAGGDTRSLRLDISRIHIGGELVPDDEIAFLELWGGVATDCSQRELLWASPALSDDWRSYCVTLRPQHFTDNLTLRARSDQTLPTAVYVIVDRMVPVASCP